MLLNTSPNGLACGEQTRIKGTNATHANGQKPNGA